MLRARSRPKRTKAAWGVVATAAILLGCTALFFLRQATKQQTGGGRPESRAGQDRHRLAQRALTEAEAGRFPVTREDLVVVLPSDESHLPLVKASRSWRKGIRTLVAVNNTQLAEAHTREGGVWKETWAFYPDDDPLRANYPGDTRAAIVPFLAHKLLGGSFKWLLYGDDDTQWFTDGVLKLVKDLDYDLPYFVTDNLWWSSVNGTIGYQPNLEAPRCLPCGYSSYGRRPEGVMQFNAPEGCPCTPQLLCNADERQVFDDHCNIPLHLVPAFSTRTYSMHGGAGGLMSIGMLRAVNLKQMEDCIAHHGQSTGGDAFITICMWKLGFAHTDPGPWFNDPAMRLFDAAAGLSSVELAVKLSEAAQGRCRDPICNDALIDHMVSSHVHSRKAGSIQQAADMIMLLSHTYQGYIDNRQRSNHA